MRTIRNLMKVSLVLMGFSLCVNSPKAETAAPLFISQSERLALPSLSGISRVRFVTTVDFPPFNTLNAQGQLSGYNIDLAKALCQQLNITQICQIEAVPWNELEQRLRDGEAEAIIAGLQPTKENRADFTFTRSYLRFPARFVTRIDKGFTGSAAQATRGKPVGVVWGTAHEQLLKSYFPEARATLYPDRETMLADLANDKLTAAFDDGVYLSRWISSSDAKGCCAFTDGPYLAPQYLGQGLSIAVLHRNTPLATAFNNALQALQQKGAMDELYLRYFPVGFF